MNKKLSDIIKHHYYLQYGCFFSELVDTQSALYSFNDVMECFIWNHVFPYEDNCNLKRLIVDSERYFLTRDRKPCVYLDEYNNKQKNIEVLSQAGYKCVDNEAWLIYPNNKERAVNAVALNPIEIKKLSYLNDFCAICSECFGEQYSIAIEREYNRFQVHKKVSHFVFAKDNVVVGIGSLYSYGEYVFIHNVGVKEQYRRKGFANDLMQHLINEAFRIGSGNAKVILQCDGGGFIEEMYLKLGFENLYRRWGYLKE